MRLVLALLFALAAQAATAQQGNVPFPRGYEEAQAAFLALPLEERRAIQAALVWTGDFSAMASGEFGRLTFQGLTSFQHRQGMQRPDAILTPDQRRALTTAANRARTGARFEPTTDGRTGLRFGLPLAIFDAPRSDGATGSRYAARDDRASLETFVNPRGERDLGAYFERLRTVQAPRTVTYSLLRPDFFVITGALDPQRRYYIRVARRGADLVGYTLVWAPARTPEFDRIVVAVANSFEPAAAATPAAAPVVATPQAPPHLPEPAATNVATAVVVAPNVALAPAQPLEACRTLTLGDRSARITGRDQASGLATLSLDGAGAPLALADQAPAAGAQLLFLAYGPGGLLATPANAGADGIVLPVQAGQSGGALLDRHGRLVGIVLGPGRIRAVSIGSVATAVPQRVVTAETVVRLVSATPMPASGAPLAPADIVARSRGAVSPVACRR
jgi:hypothetical protein